MSIRQPALELRASRRPALAIGLVTVAGIAAFSWPLVLGAGRATPDGAHSGDAPLVFALLVPALLAVVGAEHGCGRMNAKTVATLAVLTAIGTVLRLPGGLVGFNPLFFLLIVAGRAYGPSFGFLLGAFTLCCSALATGGVGPWLPFQMLAAGWVGLGTGLLVVVPRGHRLEVPALAAYGALAAVGYNVVMDLWFWPLAVTGPLGPEPGLGLLPTLGRFFAFHAATSAAWDVTGAVGNAIVLLALCRPTLRVLERAGRRLRFDAVPSGSEAAPTLETRQA